MSTLKYKQVAERGAILLHTLPMFNKRSIYICRGGQRRNNESFRDTQSTPRHATESQSHHMTSSKRKWHHGFNLQLRELGPRDRCVWGGGGYCGEKATSHCDFAVSGCQVGLGWGGGGWGCKRRRETIGFFVFSFPFAKSRLDHPLHHVFHTLSLGSRLLQFIIMKAKRKKKRTRQTEKCRTDHP